MIRNDKILDGKEVAKFIEKDFKYSLKLREIMGNKTDKKLVVIQVGSDPASSRYVKNKEKACERVGVQSETVHLQETISENGLLDLIDSLNEDETVAGIMVQLPLPNHIDEHKVICRIDPKKDVDGFHPYNVGILSIGESNGPSILVPATAVGIIELLDYYNIDVEGKECVVVGRSNIVGKPVANLLLYLNGTVTICHSKTKNLKEICKRADILVVAVGKPKFINREYVKEGAVVIDVGINHDENGKLCGDVDFDDVLPVVSKITPVPGGVGPLTVSCLIGNCIEAMRE